MKKRKIFWGIFFVVMAMVVIVSKIGILPDVGVFSLLATVFLVWMAADGLKHRNFYEMMFAAAFLCIIYDEPLGIEALTPWTVLAAALLFGIGFSLLFGGRGKRKDSIKLEWDSSGSGEAASCVSSAAVSRFAVKIISDPRSATFIPITSARRTWRIISGG